jgi:excisionase family DNA binding protein
MEYSSSMTKKTGISGNGTDQPSENFLESMTINEVADAIGCDHHTVRALISKGGLRAYRVGNTGRLIRILKSDFDALWKPFAIYDPNFLKDHG